MGRFYPRGKSDTERRHPPDTTETHFGCIEEKSTFLTCAVGAQKGTSLSNRIRIGTSDSNSNRISKLRRSLFIRATLGLNVPNTVFEP